MSRYVKTALVFLLSSLVMIAATRIDAGEWSKEMGNSKFGGFIKLDYDFTVGKENAKSWASITGDVGAKLFGARLGLIGGDLLAGNMGSVNLPTVTGPSATQQGVGLDFSNASADLVALKNWKLHSSFYCFGITLLSYDRNIDDASVELQGEPNLFSISRYFRKQMPTLRWPVGPVTMEIRYGASLNTSIKPKVKYASKMEVNESEKDMKGIALDWTPKVSAVTFAEGGVNAWVLRGGVGANLTLFEGFSGLIGYLDVLGNAALVKTNIGIDLLKGAIYAFVDRRSLKCSWRGCSIKWSRWFNHTITEWKGFSWRMKDKILYADGVSM